MEFIVGASNRMLDLINDLLSYSRVNTTKIHVESVDVLRLLEEVLDGLQTSIQEKQAIIEVGDLPEDLQGDPTKLRQLFQNLLTNALKFSREDLQPLIRISCKQEVNQWRFLIQDNGIGIDPAYQKKIFLLFQRAPQFHKI